MDTMSSEMAWGSDQEPHPKILKLDGTRWKEHSVVSDYCRVDPQQDGVQRKSGGGEVNEQDSGMAAVWGQARPLQRLVLGFVLPQSFFSLTRNVSASRKPKPKPVVLSYCIPTPPS